MRFASRAAFKRVGGVTLAVVCLQLVPGNVDGRYIEKKKGKGTDEPNHVLVLDGTSVHNVGQLQMHFLNWGEWGSRPGTGAPYSFAPSAQWPAGSGVDYLFSAGLWVGAIKGGIPVVTTAAFENEFRPSQDPRDRVYRTKEGAEGGDRPPSITADDDRDGRLDEDRLDGYDNDGDGLIDEDFRAISSLMYTCRYNDDQPVSKQIYAEHNPLHIVVRQESYQWDADRFDDFVGIEYHITNVGNDLLEDVFVGMFVDGDAGPREVSHYWEDDLTGIRSLRSVCTDLGPVFVGDIAFTYDDDGDRGRTPGWLGVMFLGHTTDPTGVAAPDGVGIKTYAYFSGQQAFQLGGDPTSDFERYEILSQGTIESDAELPRDYRMLISAGPFPLLVPDSTIVVQVAFVAGEGEFGMLANAVSARLVAEGAWVDFDHDRTTGVEGRESRIWGPRGKVWEDECRKNLLFDQGCDRERWGERFSQELRHIPEGEFVWSNADCEMECIFKSMCAYVEAESLKFRTGAGGRETHIAWLIGSAPPPPNMRIDDHARDGVVIYWDNFSEVVPDIRSQRFDFEGYRLWRADDWARPLGTSIVTGPPTELWSALFQADVFNFFGEDIGLEKFFYEPLVALLSPSQRQTMLDKMIDDLLVSPDTEPPCPFGVSTEVCDTLKALARWELGLKGGRRYYRHLDRSVHVGAHYFYSIVAFDHGFDENRQMTVGLAGDPASNFIYVVPKSASQPPHSYDENEIYVVPNPVTKESLAGWALGPTNDDPTGIKVDFRNLPPSKGVIRVYTLAGDLVKDLPFDATTGVGSVSWDLVSRSGQSITSGVYLYSIEFEDSRFGRVVKKFTVIQ